MARILLVEDDRRTVELLTELLSTESHALESARTGEAALHKLQDSAFDLIILDIMLPGRDGFSICAEIRAHSQVPILMLSARGGADDRVDGLRIGADDYLPKPFDARELTARIDALLRRAGLTAPLPSTGGVVRAGALEVRLGERRARYQGEDLELTAAEFDILRVLVERAGRVVSRERLMELARGAEFGAFDRAVDVHVSHIRRKLGDDPRAPTVIRTVRGVGYALAKPSDA
ncbi:MAG: response regulator transcription factor [Alphaproteobacteria bacterium]|nr:response regulator transcription factor [Alphaproteobacteria bacterium]